MRIKSKFQDFYDWELSCSYDDTLIYNRDYRSKTIESDRESFYYTPKVRILIGNICASLALKSDWIHTDRKVRSKFIKFCDENEIHLERKESYLNVFEPEFTIKEDLRFYEGSKGDRSTKIKLSKTEKTGELLLSQPMRVLMSAFAGSDSVFLQKEINELLRIQCQNANLIRHKYDIKAPVALIYGDTAHENISFMRSGIDVVSILSNQPNQEYWLNQQQIAAEIDSYLQETYNEELTVTSNDDRIVSNGFDLKVSFRNRGE